MTQKIIGTDLGGTTYSSALFDDRMHPINRSEKKDISAADSTEILLDSISRQINNLIKDADNVAGIGISCPGPLNSKKGIILDTPNLKLLQNINLKKEIEDRCDLPVYIENDANLFTLGEWYGDGKSKGIFGGLTLGTGLGFGLVINGSMYKGAHGLAMEYAISPIEDGNWETNISINAIKKIYSKETGKKFEPIEIFNMAKEGKSDAIKTWEIFGENLGRVLCHYINMLDPHKISIGGGLSGAFEFFEPRMRAMLEEFSPSFAINKTIIFESKDKELSAMIGAGILAAQSLNKNL